MNRINRAWASQWADFNARYLSTPEDRNTALENLLAGIVAVLAIVVLGVLLWLISGCSAIGQEWRPLPGYLVKGPSGEAIRVDVVVVKPEKLRLKDGYLPPAIRTG